MPIENISDPHHACAVYTSGTFIVYHKKEDVYMNVQEYL